MKGWIIYHKAQKNVTENDYGVSRLLEAAKSKNIELQVFAPHQFDLIVSRDDSKSILVDGKPTPTPDFILPRQGSCSTYFSLAIIRQFERMKVYTCNSSKAIETVMDKMHMHQLLAESDLPTPKTMLLKFPINAEAVKREIGFPIVIKNITGTEGKGIYLCQTEEEFVDLMELIRSNNHNTNIILQEFIKKSSGKDLRVFVLGGRIVGCMQRTSDKSFKANFSRGGSVMPYQVTPEIEWLATETARLVNLDVTGIDLLFDEEGYKICEANSSPGFKGLEQVTGRNIAEQILDYITIKVKGCIPH